MEHIVPPVAHVEPGERPTTRFVEETISENPTESTAQPGVPGKHVGFPKPFWAVAVSVKDAPVFPLVTETTPAFADGVLVAERVT